MANIARIIPPNWSAVIAYQPWLNGERGPNSAVIPGAKRTRNDGIKLILRGEDPIAAGLQADDFTSLEFPVPRGVDLDHGLALAP